MRQIGLIGLALAMAALPSGPAMAQVPPGAAVPLDGTLLDVQAEGRVRREPDLALVTAGVVAQAPSAAAAMRAQAQGVSRVLAALDKAGIAARDVQTTRVSLQPQYRYAQNEPPAITGYQAANSVSVRFRDIARAGAVLDALVAAGANQIEGPSLTFADPDQALDDARREAMARARARAELYAKAAGLRVDRIVAISEGGALAGPPQPMIYALARKAEADTPIRPGESEVSATLSVRFLLK